MTRWQWYVLGALPLFIGFHLAKQYRQDYLLDRESVRVAASVTKCSFVRSSGLVLSYEYSVSGNHYEGKGACNELKSECSEEQCCIGTLIEFEYLQKDPSVCRIKQPVRIVTLKAGDP